MDRLDIRIVRELTQGQTAFPARPGLLTSYRQLARVLGVSPGTVRNRVMQMVDSGFLEGRMAYVNPRALGLQAAADTVEVAPSLSKEAVIEEISRLDGVIFFENFRGRLLGIGFMHDGEAMLARRHEQFARIARASSGQFSPVAFPPCTDELTTAEWRLVDSLMDGDQRSYAQLSRRLGVSQRTVRRRIDHLVRVGAIFTFPRMNYRKLEGGVTTELLVTFRDPGGKAEAERRILHRIDEWLTFVGPWEQFDMFRLILPNVALAGDLVKEIGRIPGVRSVRGELVEEVIDRFRALRPYLERHLAAAAGSARAGSPSQRERGPALHGD